MSLSFTYIATEQDIELAKRQLQIIKLERKRSYFRDYNKYVVVTEKHRERCREGQRRRRQKMKKLALTG